MFDLKGKAVAVMGGTSGMGLAIAAAMEAGGADVVALGRDDEFADAARRALSGRVLRGDAARPETADALIRTTLEAFGRLDALVHVAGGSGRSFGDGPVHELTDDGLRRTLELNLHSVVWSNRAAICTWLEQKTGGSIVNIGSVLAGSPSPRFFSAHAYAAAKAAVEGFSRSLAACYAPQGIRVNVVAPGLIETPMAQRAAGDAAIMEYVRSKQPLEGGRIGCPDDVTGAVLFLVSDAARFCTGQVIAVDGGWSVTDAGFALPP